MAYTNPKQLSPFQKRKVKEIAECIAQGLHPFHVTFCSSMDYYKVTADDVRNYFESINHPYDYIW
jgi:hypothetical protein